MSTMQIGDVKVPRARGDRPDVIDVGDDPAAVPPRPRG